MTIKQRQFVKKYIESGNGTKAALEAYDTTDPNVAHAIASENLQKPTVREAIEEALRSSGLTLDQIAGNLGEIANTKAEKVTGDTVLRANVELLKLHGAYPDKKSYQYSYSVKQNLSSLPLDDLKKEIERIDNELDELLGDGVYTPTD